MLDFLRLSVYTLIIVKKHKKGRNRRRDVTKSQLCNEHNRVL